jgi:hypothetical protein
VRLVLGQHNDLTQRRVHQIRYSEVDKAVLAAKGNGRLGTVFGQGHEALALAAGENNSENLLWHGSNLGHHV